MREGGREGVKIDKRGGQRREGVKVSVGGMQGREGEMEMRKL